MARHSGPEAKPPASAPAAITSTVCSASPTGRQITTTSRTGTWPRRRVAALPEPPYLASSRYGNGSSPRSRTRPARGGTRPQRAGHHRAAPGHVAGARASTQRIQDGAELLQSVGTTIEPEILGANTATLIAAVAAPADSTDVCVLPSTSGYRGPENQLYRVEIHRGGGLPSSGADGPAPPGIPVMSVPPTAPGTAAASTAEDSGAADGAATTPTFMWSRDNGSVVFPITKLSGTLLCAMLGRDPKLRIEVGNYVQIVDDAYESQGEPGPLERYPEPLHLVKAVDPVNRIVTLDAVPATSAGKDPSLHPFLRRWDQEQEKVTGAHHTIDPDDNAIQVEEGAWIELELGVQISFVEGGSYRAGDYWLIPARVAPTGNVEWPHTPATGTAPASPASLPPFGVDYRIAPLALAVESGNVVVTQKF